MSPRLVRTTLQTSSGGGARCSILSARPCASILSNDETLLEQHSGPRPQLLSFALELAAGGEDVATARRAHRARIASVEDDLGEAFDRLPVRALVGTVGPSIERNEIDLRWQAPEQPHKGLRIGGRIIDALQHHVFERDASRIGRARIVTAGI